MEKIPSPKEIEKEIGEFLAKKFGGEVRIISPLEVPEEVFSEKTKPSPPPQIRKIAFDLKPDDLISHLDQYIIRQDHAKAVLATKICTHFNRIKRSQEAPDGNDCMVGRIKNNILMIGPTGVGKTYMVKLIAKKIGVPFVKGDATKFSETGYVGGDVEDLIRDLVRESDGNIELAQNGIIYIDEVDKIASSHNMIGADISRTGVQRALLKPMEETEVELKVPHDPISMIQEIERFRKTGQRDKRTVNTKNILFIMSGAFSGLSEIISKRIRKQGMGFGANITGIRDQSDILKQVKTEDLIAFGFESEFVGRLPVQAVFERLTEDDLFSILKNPNNPVILGKKLDFAAYGIDVKFEELLLKLLAKTAFEENTGARGLVSAVEKALLSFERTLPSTAVRKFPATRDIVRNSEKAIEDFISPEYQDTLNGIFEKLADQEKASIKEYIESNKKTLTEKHNLMMTPSRIDTAADFYCKRIMDIGSVIRKIKSLSDEVKKIELCFYKKHDINIVMEEDAIDFIMGEFIHSDATLDDVYKKISSDFEYGLKLVREKTGRNRFFITREALLAPEPYISRLLKNGPVIDTSRLG
ncbi:MAG: ATPase [Desulfobacteraceae bacterium IS3]|nr:MAG: ATPase [Desulfobacteraceae bacterium IS3]